MRINPCTGLLLALGNHVILNENYYSMSTFFFLSAKRGVATMIAVLLTLSAVFGLFVTSALAVADTLASTVYIDADKNGTVDHLKWTFDELITQCTYEAGDWTVNTAGSINVAITGIDTADPEGTGDGSCDGTDVVVYLSVTADAHETGGVTDPVVSYANAGTAGSLADSGAITAKASQTQTDEAAPTVGEVRYEDDDDDGKIDQFTILFTESVVAASTFIRNNFLSNDLGDFTGLSFAVGGVDLITSTVSSVIYTATENTVAVDTHDDSGDLEFRLGGTFNLNDTIGNSNDQTDIAGDLTSATYSDGAAPVIVSVTQATTVNGLVYITFSEEIHPTFNEGTEFTITPDPGTLTSDNSPGVDGEIITLEADTGFTCPETYNIVLDETEIDAVNGTPTALVLTGPEDGDWTFGVNCGGSGSGGGGGATIPTYSALVLSPNGGESLTVGSVKNITWSTGGTGSLSYVDLALSVDGGTTYTAIAEDELNDGTYTWTVPSTVTTAARVKVSGHNNLAVLATDISDTDFAIVAQAEPPIVETPDEVTEPGTGTYGPSPVTGELEEISVVSPGDLVRTPYFNTVYYIDENFVRRPFFNEQIFATWYNNFDDVKVVTDATLPTLTIGTNMLPKPGVVWVKVQSLAKVYVVETNPDDAYKPTLRWVTNEALAAQLLGPDWADYVMDVDATLYNRFDFGADILNTSDVTVNKSMMKKRVELSI